MSTGAPPRGVTEPASGLSLTERSPLSLREEIAVSWQRSRLAGLPIDEAEIPYEPDLDIESRLSWAAGPVLDRVAEDLVQTSISLILTDERAAILDRRVGDRNLLAGLDRVSVAPGFRFRETDIGTNAIGTALEQQAPCVVEAGEHFVTALGVLACAAAPIADPRTGRMLGVVDLTTRAAQANPLMLPFAKRAAWEIEQRLLDDTLARDRTLHRHFFEARRRTKVALVVVNDHTILINTAAAALVDSSDRARMWDWAQQTLFGQRPLESTVPAKGRTLKMVGCEPITDGGQVVGAALQVTVPTPSSDSTLPPGRRSYRERPAFGWASLTNAERSVAATVAEGLTNAEAGARLYLSPHTVNFHLRQIFRKLDISSRVQLTRVVVGATTEATRPPTR